MIAEGFTPFTENKNPAPGKRILIQWKPVRRDWPGHISITRTPVNSDDLYWHPYKSKWAILAYKVVD